MNYRGNGARGEEGERNNRGRSRLGGMHPDLLHTNPVFSGSPKHRDLVLLSSD